jgi:hypothetical protein
VPLGDAGETGKREAGVGGPGDGGEQRVVIGGEAEGGELTFGSWYVGETHPGQPAGQGSTRAAHANKRIPLL